MLDSRVDLNNCVKVWTTGITGMQCNNGNAVYREGSEHWPNYSYPRITASMDRDWVWKAGKGLTLKHQPDHYSASAVRETITGVIGHI